MRAELRLDPGSRCEAVTRIEVEASRGRAGRLSLVYRLAGTMDGVLWPVTTAPARSDGLWRHTCFEAFVRPTGGEAYMELNFAPSGAWAAYRFSGYRAGMVACHLVRSPHIEARRTDRTFEMKVSTDLDQASFMAEWRLGLSAVIEEVGKRASYWALAHPEGKPDFHHSAAFALELPGGEVA